MLEGLTRSRLNILPFEGFNEYSTNTKGYITVLRAVLEKQNLLQKNVIKWGGMDDMSDVLISVATVNAWRVQQITDCHVLFENYFGYQFGIYSIFHVLIVNVNPMCFN